MKINEYNQMMKYLTRPARSEYEQVAMAGAFKGGKKLIQNLIKKGDVKKGEAPKTDLGKIEKQVETDKRITKELAESEQIPVKDQTDPSTLTTEELIEFRKTNRAGKGQFTNAEAIIARLENTIKGMNPDDEEFEYVTTTFPNFIKELKANPKLAENENVWNNLMSDLPEDQRFIKYDDGTVDFQTKRPSHTFKLRKDLDTDRRGPVTSGNDVVKSPYKFTGDETLDDLYKLEEQGIISRSDYNVYGERYLDYVDAQVAKRFGYTEQEVNKMPIGRLNVLRAKANPNWAEANYGDDYMRILEKERAAEVEAGVYDDPGMFDNMFNKMQKEMDDYIPGEAPKATSKEKLYDEYIYYRDELGNFKGSFDDFIVARRKAGSLLAEETPLSAEAVKRKQNAEGGLIGGGMIEGEDLGDRTGFARPKPVPPAGSEEFLDRILKQKNLKSWEDMSPGQRYTFSNVTFPNYLKQQKQIGDKIPAKEFAKKLGVTLEQLKGTRKIKKTRKGEKATSVLGDKIKEVLGEPISFDNLAGTPRGEAMGSATFYKNPTKEEIEILKQYVSKKDQSNIIQRPILERMKNLVSGKKGERFLNILKTQDLSDEKTLENINKLFNNKYTPDELGTAVTRIAQVMDGQQFRGADFIDIDKKTSSKIFTEIQSAQYGNPLRTASYQLALKGLDKELKGKGSLNFKTYRNNIQKELKKIGLKGAFDIDEYFGVSVGGLKEGFHDYSVFSRALQSDLNSKNLANFQGTLSRYINELDTIENKKELFSKIDEFNKKIKAREKDLKVELPKFYKGTAQQAFGKKRFAELQAQGLQFKTNRPYSIQIPKGAMTQKEILSSLKSGEGVTKTLDQITKDAVAYSAAKKMKGPKLKSVVIPGAQSLGEFTSSIIDDIAKGAYGKAALKKLGLYGTVIGTEDAAKTLAKGESGLEAGADFFGLKGILQNAMETASLTPEGRDIRQRTAREQLQKNLQESGFMGGGLDQSGIASIYPTELDQPVTEAEARQLQTEQDIYRSRKEGIEQLRRQLGEQQAMEFMSKTGIPTYSRDEFLAYGGRVGFEKGGSSSDKKKTPLDKPTVQIDPNAPIDPAKRDTLKGAGILGAGIAAAKLGLFKLSKLGKAAKAAKVAPLTKVVAPVGKTMSEFPEWFPTLINRARKEGIQTPIYGSKQIKLTEAEYNKLSKEEAKDFYDSYMGRTDEYIQKLKAEGEPRYSKWVDTDEIVGYEYKLKDRPDLEIVERNGENISVTFPNAYGEPVEMYYKAPKGTKDAHFQIDDSVPELNWMGFQDDHHVDFYGETVNNLDEVYGGASDLEQYVLKTKKPRYTQGDEVVARADAQYDVIKDTAEDLDEF